MAYLLEIACCFYCLGREHCAGLDVRCWVHMGPGEHPWLCLQFPPSTLQTPHP